MGQERRHNEKEREIPNKPAASDILFISLLVTHSE